MSAINNGAYFCVGADVTVVTEHGNWLGRIVSMGSTSAAQISVSVLDPAANPLRRQGERVEVSWTQLRQAPRVVMWR